MRRGLGTLVALALAMESAAAPAQADVAYSNPVVASDVPDPSVIGVHGGYWATATSGDWAPAFPLLQSTDLVNWTLAGSLFDRPPAWTAGAYWAPALSFRDGRFLAYYAARRRGGKPCIGVAAARAVSGPYHDRGPILCPGSGAIDPQPFAVSARRGVLLYKKMGVGGTIRIVQLSGDGMRATGEGVAVLRPTLRWERGVTENPFLVARPDGFYLLYSGGHCCRPPCSYATGIARSPTLLGPYVKAPAPLLVGNASWMCPGGGVVVTDAAGHDQLAYHAYRRGNPSQGREMLLDGLTWGADGWPVAGSGQGPSATATSPQASAQLAPRALVDDFSERALGPGWQWPFDRRPRFALRGALVLSVVPGTETATYLGRLAPWAAFVATTVVERSALRPRVTAGLALLRAGHGGKLGIAVSTHDVEVWRRQNGRSTIVAHQAPALADRVWLRFVVPGDGTATAQRSVDGTSWVAMTTPQALAPGFDGARVVLAGSGPRPAVARFDLLRIDPYVP